MIMLDLAFARLDEWYLAKSKEPVSGHRAKHSLREAWQRAALTRAQTEARAVNATPEEAEALAIHALKLVKNAAD